MQNDINECLRVLQNGGVILYPTDTVWGIGCDATNAEAVSRVFALKKRVEAKSLIVLLDNDNKLQNYVSEVPDIAYTLIEYTERPLTIIYPGAKNVAPNVVHSDGTLGIRIVKHDFCQKLIERFRKPIVSTSANLSGDPTPALFSEVNNEIRSGVDYVVQLEQNLIIPKEASAIIRLEVNGTFEFIRR
ncbi:MAG: threonylcarbamoyl-AMP synthase [Mucilaginibacter polytrichastri]|nr:threonylcarbamoyl-AMP synthase [Mucilaginibacter polytrichastri]